jgi:exopolysaccharide biosynthesis polyprenyl glycosylphosphotransferase
MIDLVCVYFAIYFACEIRHTTLPFEITLSSIILDPANPFRFVFIFWILATLSFLNVKELYQTRREVMEGFEIGLLLRAVMFSALLLIIVIYVLKIQGFPRTVLFIGASLMMLFLSIWRVFKRFFVEYLVVHGYNNFNAVIIGAGKVGIALADEIKRRPELGINIVGYLDDFKEGNPDGNGLTVLGKIGDFVPIARKEFVNKVFITSHHDSRMFLRILREAKDLGVAVRVIPQGFQLMSGDFVKYNIGIIPILEYCEADNFRKQFGKRVFDFTLSLFLTIIAFPFLIFIAIWVKCDSRGPVLYSSCRYGRGGRKFHMYKFRSMVADADKAQKKYKENNEVDGPIFKIKKDPRVTRVGRFLRKYSLDELPQLFNVLKGDMSLVGPRPLPIDQIEKEDLKQLKRLEVRPGITGLWQIRGRSDISFRRLLRWDMWYINNWSLWLDLNILVQTVPVVFKGTGAY